MASARTNRTPKRRKAFLEALKDTGNVTASCRRTHIARSCIYTWREDDPAFAKEWDAALDLGMNSLEDALMVRAKDGTLRPVFHLGVKCGSIREYSDTLGMFLLKAHRPEKYRDNLKIDASMSHTVKTAPLTEEELIAECERRGLPTKIFQD